MGILAVAALVGTAAGAGQDERQLFKDSRANLRKGEYDEARHGFERLATKQPANWEPRRYLLRAFLEMGRADDARNLCESFLKTDPDHVGARVGLGESHLELGAPARALESADEALKKAPKSPAARLLRARALTELGRDDEAQKLLEPFVDEYNSGRDALMRDDLLALCRGLTLYADLSHNSEIYKQAVTYALPEVLKADPADPMVKTILGDCYREKYNRDAATSSYQDALGTNPKFAPALAGLATLMLDQNQIPPATMMLERAIATNPACSEAHYLKAWIHLRSENLTAARDAVKHGLEQRPHSATLRSLLSALEFALGDEKAAEAESKKVLDVNPKSPLPYWETGRVLIQAGGRQFEAANAFLKKAADLNPRFWPALIDYGMNCLRVGDEETGRRILEDANKKDPFNKRVQNTVNLFNDFDKEFIHLTPSHYRVRLAKKEQSWMEPYVLAHLERSWTELTKRYGFTPAEPVLVEVFFSHSDFSVRTVGVPDLGALGACFGRVVTTLSPAASKEVGQPFNWGAVLWHEMAHVFALQMSDYRVPSWFTEGLSTYEEKLGFGGWERNIELEIMNARHQNQLGGVSGLDRGQRGANPILTVYHQGSLILEYIDKQHGGFLTICKFLKAFAAKKKTTEAFKDILNLSLADFDKGFFAWLDGAIARNKYLLPPKEGAAKLQAEHNAKPKDGAIAAKLCHALLAENKVDAALKIGKLAVEAEPANASAHAFYGQALLKKRNLEEAIEQLRLATEKGADDYRTWYALGTAYLDSEKPAEAIPAFEKARDCFPRLVNDPEGTNAYRRLNDCHVAVKNYDAALTDLERMVAVDPLDFKNRLRVARLELERKNGDAALRVLQEAAWIETHDRSLHSLLAQAFVMKKEYDKAIDHHRIELVMIEGGETQDAAADKAAKLCDLGEVHLLKGEKAKAREYAAGALKAVPGHERAQKLYEDARER